MSTGLIALLIFLIYTINRQVQQDRLLKLIIELLPKNHSVEQIVDIFNQRLNLNLSVVDDLIVPPTGWGYRYYQNQRAYLLLSKFLPAFKSLIDSQKSLEQSAKFSALGELAAGIAHEINNPIAIIQGIAYIIYGQLSGDSINQGTQQELADKSKMIIETTERMDKIVNGLRYFMQDDKKFPKETVEIQEILDSVQIFSIEKCKRHGINVTIDFIDNHSKLYCKPMQIAQVLINLVNNSFDAIKDSSNPWIKISVKVLSNQIVFLVQDSGLGIPIEIQEKILQPFYTSKAMNKSSGSGLGLSISKRIIDQHQGTITVDNSYKNTTFVVTLPKQEEK